MKPLYCLLTLLSVTILTSLKAQPCGDLSDELSKFYRPAYFYDYEYKQGEGWGENFDSTKFFNNLDSLIYYNKKIVESDSCSSIKPAHLVDLTVLHFMDSSYRKSKKYAWKVISLKSKGTFLRPILDSTNSIKKKVEVKHDTLMHEKFKAYKTLGKIYLHENKGDSLKYILKVTDSLKSRLCHCMTCHGRQNNFLANLESDFYVKNNKYNEALRVWKSYGKGHRYINKRIVDVLQKKHGNVKGLFKVKKFENSAYSRTAFLKVDDEVINEFVVNIRHECKNEVKDCLARVDYLEDVF